MDNSLTNAGKLPRKSRQKKASYLMKSRFQTAHFQKKKQDGPAIPLTVYGMSRAALYCNILSPIQLTVLDHHAWKEGEDPSSASTGVCSFQSRRGGTSTTFGWRCFQSVFEKCKLKQMRASFLVLLITSSFDTAYPTLSSGSIKTSRDPWVPIVLRLDLFLETAKERFRVSRTMSLMLTASLVKSPDGYPFASFRR